MTRNIYSIRYKMIRTISLGVCMFINQYNMKCGIILLILSLSHLVYSQNHFIDKRDSTHYDIFQIENHLWFKTNLKYKSQTSWCKEYPDAVACKDGNFYYSTDLVNVCPVGWRVPTWGEYKKAIKFIERQKELPPDSISYSENVMPYKKYKIIAERIVGITLIGDTAFFDMGATGWVQGEEWEPQAEATMWVVEDISNSPQPHVHIFEGQIIKHAHAHNVLDKPKNVRRFSVRCISDVKR